MALKRKHPAAVLWSRPVLIFVPVLGLLSYGFVQAATESERYHACVDAGVTVQRAHLCMESVTSWEAMILDAYGYPYWLLPDAEDRQVEEAVSGICRAFARGRDGVRRNDCACALDALRADLAPAEFAALAQSLAAQPEGDLAVTVPRRQLAALDDLFADPLANVPAEIDGEPVQLPAGFAFASGVPDQWTALSTAMLALEDGDLTRLAADFSDSLEACLAPD